MKTARLLQQPCLALSVPAWLGGLLILISGLLSCILHAQDLTVGRCGYWKFDETTGLTAKDSTSNQNQGQLMDYFDPAQAWMPGKVGRALQFDGLFNRAVIPYSPSLNPSGDASFAFWLKPDTYGTVTSAGNYDISEGHILRLGTRYDLYLLDNPGSVRQTLLFNGTNAPQNSVQLNEWQHFAVILKGNQATFFKNGFPLGNPATAALGNTEEINLVLGSNAEELTGAERLYQGLMDEVGIWERPLTESEILTLAGKDASGAPLVDTQSGSLTRLEDGTAEFMVFATGLRPITYQWYHNGSALAGATSNYLTLTKITKNNAGAYTVMISNAVAQTTSAPMQLTVDVIRDVKTGLIGYWNFDETSGTTWRDASGHNHHATIQNTTAMPGVTGQIGGACDLNGVDTFAVIPHDTELVLSDQASIAVWVNPRGYGGGNGWGRILRKGINYDFLLLGSSQSPVFNGINKTAYRAPTNSVELNVWQQFVFTFKNGAVRFYRNGQPSGDPITGQLSPGTTDPLVIGNYQADLAIARVFDGLMDDLGLWNRALNPEEIAEMYQNGLAGKPLDTPLTPLVPLRIQSFAAIAGNKMQLQFTTPYSGKTYVIQQTASLTAPNWSSVNGVQFDSPSQGLMQATFNRSADAAVFLRVMVAP